MRIARLAWGVKQSFRAYVEGSGGSIDTLDGATRAVDGTLVFEATGDSDLAVGPDGAPTGTGRFQGQVKFTAHGGMLSVTLSDPWVEARDGGLVLSIAETATRRTAIATLGAAAPGPEGAVEIPAAMTLDGMMIVGDHYPPGTPLDPVRLLA
ncbi:MAG: HtaA domain-containing protein [Phenylobacterium sp.]|nr:HtaA domain-containing protein [Phenylobacterium sp.]